MTILTKPSNEKKAEKVALPMALGGDEAMLHGGVAAGGGSLLRHQYPHHSDVEADFDAESMVFNRPQFTCIKTLFLFLTALIVMMMGIMGGYTLYRMYAPPHANMHYRAMCDIPYASASNASVPRLYTHTRPDDFVLNWRNLFPQLHDEPVADMVDDNFFREEIELDMSDSDGYAKIDVPDFKDGRRGRFMHDFKENESAIIDTTANRCFIMPLDRDTTLPPKNFMDLMKKMGSGYYNIDTDRVRRTMRVVAPPITDLSLISQRIANECFDMKVYMLENYVSGVFKREAHLSESGKFAEFSGKGIVEFNLVNIDDIEAYESNQLAQK